MSRKISASNGISVTGYGHQAFLSQHEIIGDKIHDNTDFILIYEHISRLAGEHVAQQLVQAIEDTASGDWKVKSVAGFELSVVEFDD
ncbi:hypothetical protein TR80_001915 [Xanthomonas campestris]|uniref:hypothetical protein n=1 Tax=Xanthomonas TaxID=338 RepID=UPI0011AF0A21|nr:MULTISPECIES: hypothetical protein [Xanthomonas]TXD45187.1 hypothetical protein TR80_001915 [Xanthomonas campestris]